MLSEKEFKELIKSLPPEDSLRMYERCCDEGFMDQEIFGIDEFDFLYEDMTPTDLAKAVLYSSGPLNMAAELVYIDDDRRPHSIWWKDASLFIADNFYDSLYDCYKDNPDSYIFEAIKGGARNGKSK